MKNKLAIVTFICLGFLSCTDKAADSLLKTEANAVVELMKEVCDWQLSNPSERIDDPNEMWERAVFYIGVMSLYDVSGDKKYLSAAYEWSSAQDYKLGPRKFHGDDQVVAQVYLSLYDIYKDGNLLQDTKTTLDSMMRNHSWKGSEVWNWCDGLFMAPPVLAHMSAITKDKAYLVYMDSLWWDTYEMLYDPEQRLFYRDNRYINKLDKEGNKIFWSRGNGWVIAGISRVLNHLPKDHPNYEVYVSLFQEMSESISALQSSDGFWKSNLLDTLVFPEGESSGTAFFVYAFCWGINKGLLSADDFLPVIKNGWNALTSAVDQEGRLGFVQQPWHEPGPVFAEGRYEYGTGAFLLAASEYHKLLEALSEK